MIRLGVVAALAAEARLLTAAPAGAGRLIPLPAQGLLLISGVGPRRALSAARTLLCAGASALVSWGFAAALKPELGAGRLILPETILASDHAAYSVDAGWHERLCRCLEGSIPMYRGVLAESSTVLCTPAEKSSFFDKTGAAAVDMESAAVARAAEEAMTPFVAIRAVTDGPEESLPRAIAAVATSGRVHAAGILLSLARRPWEVRDLVRLAGNFQAARTVLHMVIRLAGPALLCPGSPGTFSCEDGRERPCGEREASP